jgi:hypothetical protein
MKKENLFSIPFHLKSLLVKMFFKTIFDKIYFIKYNKTMR